MTFDEYVAGQLAHEQHAKDLIEQLDRDVLERFTEPTRSTLHEVCRILHAVICPVTDATAHAQLLTYYAEREVERECSPNIE